MSLINCGKHSYGEKINYDLQLDYVERRLTRRDEGGITVYSEENITGTDKAPLTVWVTEKGVTSGNTVSNLSGVILLVVGLIGVVPIMVFFLIWRNFFTAIPVILIVGIIVYYKSKKALMYILAILVPIAICAYISTITCFGCVT
jgi:hypothetical protein